MAEVVDGKKARRLVVGEIETFLPYGRGESGWLYGTVGSEVAGNSAALCASAVEGKMGWSEKK